MGFNNQSKDEVLLLRLFPERKPSACDNNFFWFWTLASIGIFSTRRVFTISAVFRSLLSSGAYSGYSLRQLSRGTPASIELTHFSRTSINFRIMVNHYRYSFLMLSKHDTVEL